MSQAVETHTPKPNRRGFLFYGSAVVAAAGLAKVALPSGPDPIHAAIDAFEQAALAYLNGPEDDDASQPLFDVREEKLDALAQIAPTTRDGVKRLLDVLWQEEASSIDDLSPLAGALRNITAQFPEA